MGRARAVSTRYAPPAEADLLTDRQRKALTELIRSMVTDEQRAGEDRADSPAPTKAAGELPAQDDYGLAYNRGTPEHQPDTTKGEENQDPGGFEGA